MLTTWERHIFENISEIQKVFLYGIINWIFSLKLWIQLQTVQGRWQYLKEEIITKD